MLISLSAGCEISSSLSFLLVAELGLSAEWGLLFTSPSLFPLRCIVFLLDAAVFADLALHLDPNLVLQALLAPFLRLPTIVVWSFSRSLTTFSLKLAGSRSATLNLATARLSARSLASVCSAPCCESSSRPCCAAHGRSGSRCSVLRDLDLLLTVIVT